MKLLLQASSVSVPYAKTFPESYLTQASFMTYGHVRLLATMKTQQSNSGSHNGSAPAGRRERKRLETREKLFEAALRLFATKGFAATTIEDITEAADVGKGTFFNYFPTKEHLLRYFGERQVTRIETWLEGTRHSDKSTKSHLKDLIATATEIPAANPELLRAMFGSFLANEDVRNFLKSQLAIGRSKLAEFLKSAQDKGEVRTDVDVSKLARTLQQTVFGSLLFWSLHQDTPPREYLESTFELLWTGMAAGVAKQTSRRTTARNTQKEKVRR